MQGIDREHLTKEYDINYGLDEQRIKTIYDDMANAKYYKTRYFFGTYEQDIDELGNVTKTDYIYTPAGLTAMIKNGTVYYVHTDHLGSLQVITNANKQIVSSYAYTPWGGRLLLGGVSITDRGYTGHEHLFPFGGTEVGLGLINMNGRVYDPVLALFLSPDPYVQSPDFTQSFNRYSYCWNNPFKYTDPSGDFVFSLFLGPVGVILDAACWGAVIGGAGYTASVAMSDGGFNNWKSGDFWKSVGVGALSGAVTAGIGSAFGAVGSNGVMGEIARAYTHGFANGMISEFTGGDFMTGFASGALGSLGGLHFRQWLVLSLQVVLWAQ